MRKIFFVPIEQIEARYSTQWNAWFEDFLEEESIPYEFILPEKDLGKGVIRSGQFLDVIGTNFYKSQQLSILCEKLNRGEISDKDVILFSDYWFPGVEMLFYIRDALNLKFKIAGILHAGTWDPNDFLHQKNMQRWARGIESGWMEQADALFVATEYHKKLITVAVNVDQNKIKVVPFPIYISISKWTDPHYYIPEKRTYLSTKPLVVFPHRLAPEKQPQLFDELFGNGHSYKDMFRSFKTAELGGLTDKQGYYHNLACGTFSISFAKQETFGIAMLESVLCGCAPIVPNSLSYKELYPEIFKYPLRDTIPIAYLNSAKEKLYELAYKIPAIELEQEVEFFRKRIILEGERAIPAMISHLMII